MKKKGERVRVPIPEELAVSVLFESDRTCCVCRLSGRGVEIHHVDGDPSNNTKKNLAVLCKDCHSDAHTTQAFARNLTPAVVQKYNETWRALVALRIEPRKESQDELVYRSETLLMIFLAPYQWRNRYIDVYPGHFENGTNDVHLKPWDHLLEHSHHIYSDEEWRYYLPLFKDESPRLIERLESTLRTYGDALPFNVKAQIGRCCRSLEMEAHAYRSLPRMLADHFEPEAQHIVFKRRFLDTLRSLKALSELADAELQGYATHR